MIWSLTTIKIKTNHMGKFRQNFFSNQCIGVEEFSRVDAFRISGVGFPNQNVKIHVHNDLFQTYV